MTVIDSYSASKKPIFIISDGTIHHIVSNIAILNAYRIASISQ